MTITRDHHDNLIVVVVGFASAPNLAKLLLRAITIFIHEVNKFLLFVWIICIFITHNLKTYIYIFYKLLP